MKLTSDHQQTNPGKKPGFHVCLCVTVIVPFANENICVTVIIPFANWAPFSFVAVALWVKSVAGEAPLVLEGIDFQNFVYFKWMDGWINQWVDGWMDGLGNMRSGKSTAAFWDLEEKPWVIITSKYGQHQPSRLCTGLQFISFKPRNAL